MIQSLYRIDFILNGRTTRLLDFGQWINDEIALPVAIGAADYAESNAEWGDGLMEGRAKRSMAFQVRRNHGSHQELRSWCIRHPELVPRMGRGVLQYSIMDVAGGAVETWEISSARILAVEPTPVTTANGFRSLTGYRIETGSARPLTIITPFQGIPWMWLNQDWNTLTTDWSNL